MKKCRQHFINAAIFSAFLNILFLAPTLYMLQVYDRVVPTRGVVTLVMLTLIFVMAVAAIGLLDLARTRLLLRANARLDRLLAGAIIEALLKVSVNASGPRNAGTLREFDTFRQTVTGAGVLALFDAPWAPIYILVCFMIHPAVGALAVSGAVVLSLLSWLNERRTGPAVKAAISREQQAYSSIDLSLGASGVLSALGMSEAMVRRHLRERFEATDQVSRAGFTSAGYGAFVKAVRLLLQSLALGLGAFLAIEQQISAGAIFASSLLISRALAPIEMINGAWKNLLQARVAYLHVIELFERCGTNLNSTVLPEPRGHLSIENLCVAAPSNDRLLIGGVTFSLEPGELLGIVGPSGAGKSTLAKALVGILAPAQGAVRLDGTELANWSPEQLGSAFGYVPQEPLLFRGTIKENIARFKTELTEIGSQDREVVRAAQACGAHDFIVRLPKGYDTELGWGGAGLSVGQSQRITLARAMFGSPAVLVLDEPNAALDAEGEMHLTRALENLRQQGVTLVVVAHRAGILASADKLLVMRGGRMEIFGERTQVLARINGPQTPPAESVQGASRSDADQPDDQSDPVVSAAE